MIPMLLSFEPVPILIHVSGRLVFEVPFLWTYVNAYLLNHMAGIGHEDPKRPKHEVTQCHVPFESDDENLT